MKRVIRAPTILQKSALVDVKAEISFRQITVISGKIEFLSISPDFVSMQTVTMWILAGNGWMV